jgi:hypothetical protein
LTAPRQAHRRARRLVYGVALLVTVLAAGLAWWIFAQAADAAPVLTSSHGPLAEALQWPYQDFPSVTDVERATIRRELSLDEPVLTAGPPLWTRLPAHPPLRPPGDEARGELAAVLEGARRLTPPDPDRPTGEEPLDLEAFETTRRALDRLPRADRSWVSLYDQGVLQLWAGNPRAAERELESAYALIQNVVRRGPWRGEEDAYAEVLEAAILNQFALGHARLAEVDGEPPSRRLASRREAIEALRAAVALSVKLGDVDPDVDHALVFFPLGTTGLPTSRVTNDLIVAYLETSAYHDCPVDEPPTRRPCDDPEALAGPCRYRDVSFCKSFDRAVPPFGELYEDLFHAFYRGDPQAWEQEHRLWALSNAVDRSAENVRMGDPYLLYNFATVLVDSGKVEAAPALLDRAEDGAAGLGGDLPESVFDRIDRLNTVSRVLAGQSPKSLRPSDDPPRSLRATYRRLYDPKTYPVAGELPLHEFEPVGSAFTPDGESVIDSWLFVLLWRDLLRQGDLTGFDREYDRLMAEGGIDKDFFRTWRREVMTALGERALARAGELDAAGEGDKAERIRELVGVGDLFPADLAWRARKAGAWRPWLAARALPVLGLALALLVVAVVWVLARALLRTHRAVMVSDYTG